MGSQGPEYPLKFGKMRTVRKELQSCILQLLRYFSSILPRFAAPFFFFAFFLFFLLSTPIDFQTSDAGRLMISDIERALLSDP